jgi:hypothetical protein
MKYVYCTYSYRAVARKSEVGVLKFPELEPPLPPPLPSLHFAPAPSFPSPPLFLSPPLPSPFHPFLPSPSLPVVMGVGGKAPGKF